MIIRLFWTFLWRTALGFMLVATLLLTFAYGELMLGLQRPLPMSEPLVYRLKPGSSLRQVAKELSAQGVLDYPTAMIWWAKARWEHKANKIKAGEYAITSTMNAEQLLNLFIVGKGLQHSVVLVEGWNFRRMMQVIQAHPKLKHTLADAQPQTVMTALGWPGEHPEGRFFPDTYQFESQTQDVDILQRAYDKMQQELKAAWIIKADNIPLKNKEEALILASIIEKETGAAEERPQIAGVFSRRLQKGMKLQTDPTVIYGLGESFDGNLRKADLQRDTPYNTYTRRGLPPTPIAMPGRAALRAAVNPAAGDSLYFVARGEGRHYFSATLREHECAVITYQLKDKAPKLFQRRCRNHRHCPVCQG